MNTVNILGYTIHTSIAHLNINKQRFIINTINPHSYCVAKRDKLFYEALQKSDILLPDGIGIVWAARFLNGIKIKRITGAELHGYLLNNLNTHNGKVFYLGSSSLTLGKIKSRIKREYPNIQVAVYSPPFKKEFTEEDNQLMIEAINAFKPNVLFVGMTAPKQEKWAYQHKEFLNTSIIASVGAVFDFYAGNVNRAPKWIQSMGLEWLHRSILKPKTLGKRNFMSNPEFIMDLLKRKFITK